MSDFKFLCPECGQKISCDSALIGAQISCPACQKTLTIPAPAATAPAMVSQSAPVPIPAGSAPPPISARAPTPKPQPSAKPLVRETEANRYSGLAIASLTCSVFVIFGFIPGIICGHLAKSRMRKDIFLVGEKIANAGLIISYCVLAVILCFSTVGFASWVSSHPHRTLPDSPNATAAPARLVDEIKIGENEEEHDLSGPSQNGSPIVGKQGRKSARSGYFSYTMKVLPRESMTLVCRYWGNEPKGRLFDIAIDDQVIATQKLDHDLQADKFFDEEYKIPGALTLGKDHVTVVFQAHPEWTAGTVYGCQMLKR